MVAAGIPEAQGRSEVKEGEIETAIMNGALLRQARGIQDRAKVAHKGAGRLKQDLLASKMRKTMPEFLRRRTTAGRKRRRG